MSIWEGRKKPIDYAAEPQAAPQAAPQGVLSVNPPVEELLQRHIGRQGDENRALHSRCNAAQSRISRLETVLQQLLLLNEIQAEDVPEKVIPAHVRLVPIKAEKKT